MRQTLTWLDEGAARAVGGLSLDHWSGLPGDVLAEHRTGRTWCIAAADSPLGIAVVAKEYRYPTFRDRRRGWLRNTWLAPSRAAREARNLAALAARGLQPALALGFGEVRDRCGVLHRCLLLLRRWDATDLAAALGGPDRAAILAALPRFVAALHRAGYVDRDLHLRNLLWNGAALAKVDCPRGAFLPPWRHRRAVRRDLAELGAGLRGRVSPRELLRLWRRYARNASFPGAPGCPAGTWPAPR